MSASLPPTENVPIFNSKNFNYSEENLTFALADRRYLKLVGGTIFGNLIVDENVLCENQFIGLDSSSAADPPYSFQSNLDTGMYLSDPTTLGFSIGGVDILTLNDTKSEFSVPALFPDGSDIAPSIAFSTDADSGLYLPAAAVINLAIAGSDCMSFANDTTYSYATNFQCNNLIVTSFSPASISTPAIVFNGATSGSNSISITDNLADALSIKEGSNSYLTFVSTNASESVDILRTLRVGTTSGSTITMRGTSTGTNTISIVDNLADSFSIQEGANKYLTFKTTNSGETVIFGRPLTFSGSDCGFLFTGSNFNNYIDFPDNLSDALTIGQGLNSYLSFRSSNGTEGVILSKPMTNASQPAFARRSGANQTITNLTLTVLTFPSGITVFDQGNISQSSGVFTCAYAGVYNFDLNISTSSTGVGSNLLGAFFTINDTTAAVLRYGEIYLKFETMNVARISTSANMKLDAGDAVRCWVYSSTSDLSDITALFSGNTTMCTICKLA